MRHYVFSTLSASVRYVNHEKGGADLPVEIGDGVLIEGGTGVMNRNFMTPRGVMTEVSSEQMEYLGQNYLFQLHKRNGFITVEDSNKDPEKVVSEGLIPGDEGRQLTPEDFGKDGHGVSNGPEASVADTGRGKAGNKAGSGKAHK